MKKSKFSLCALLVFALLAAALAGCGATQIDGTGQSGGFGPESAGSAANQADAEGISFSYSDGIGDDGFWLGVTALEYVELPDYGAIGVPANVHTVADSDMQSELDAILGIYTTPLQITDRAVEDGDTVSIDFTGSVDGVEFEGGSTGGAGTEVTIGVTNYIDDFLEQLIGRMPGETFDVEVTFPEDYDNAELAGKDAVFVTTVNHVVESVAPQLTDAFVAENLTADYGWTTVGEMEADIHKQLQTAAVNKFIEEYLLGGAVVSSMPDAVMAYQENARISYYQGFAAYYGMALEDFLSANMGLASVDELVESYHDENAEMAAYSLIIQAVAEDKEIAVTDGDVADYFTAYMGTEDYSPYEEEYGMPYLKQIALAQLVMDYLAENAVLQ